MTRCPICDGSTTETAVVGVSSCLQTWCGHIFQTDLTPTIDYAAEDYADQTYRTYGPESTLLRYGYLVGAGVPFEAWATVVDVGYGSGAFVRLLRSRQVNAFGHDVHARDDGVPRATPETLSDAEVLTFFDSLEHIPAFDEMLLRWTPEWCAVSIPWCDPLMLSLGRFNSWRHYKPGEHLHYFTSMSFALLMRRWGMQIAHESHIEDAVRQPQAGYPFNISTFVCRRPLL